LQKWLWAVGECGMALVPGIPVMREFYGAFKRAGIPASKKMLEHVFRNTSMKERSAGVTGDWPPNSSARASFYVMTGLTPEYQLALESYYRNLTLDPNDFELSGDGEAHTFAPPFIQHL